MEDDKLKELFSDFRPNLSPDSCFMSKLQDSLDKVELIRQHNLELQKRNRKAVALAACSGFIVGVVFMLLVPHTGNFINALGLSIPLFMSERLFLSYSFFTWLIAAFLSVATALAAYDISQLRLKYNKEHSHL